MKKKLLIIILILVHFTGFSATINVPGDYATIQEALNAANNNDEIIVAAGTYYENIVWPATTGIQLIGSGQESCIIDGSNISNVIRFQEDLGGIIGNATLIKGFTITNGSAPDEYMYKNGGGLYVNFSSPTFENITFTGNEANYAEGGAIYCRTPNNEISIKPVFKNITVTNNTALFRGGGAMFWFCKPTIINSRFTDNSSWSGGGIAAWNDCIVTISNTKIENNTAIIIDNPSSGRGGGIDAQISSTLILDHVSISGNIATNAGGAMLYADGNHTFTNVTIANNTVENSTLGGAIYCSMADATLVNCIMWNNTSPQVYFNEINEPNSIAFSYCDIEGGQGAVQTNGNGTVTWGDGNIDQDPMFCGYDFKMYYLAEGSPCAGTGQGDANMGAHGIGCQYVDVDISSQNNITLINYPNPFSQSTTISYNITESGNVKLMIYNQQGKLIESLIDENRTPGLYSINWNVNNIVPGLYYYSLITSGKSVTKKMLISR